MDKPTLVIRADADERMGTGHIMRCISLAQEWVNKNGHVMFISCLSNDALLEWLKILDFKVHLLEKSYPDPMDLEITLCKAKEKNAVAFVVDGYHFRPDYHKKIRAGGFKLMVIDDYNHLPSYHADILLNQNLEAKKIQYQTLPDTIKFLGSEFVMLRNEFLSAKKKQRHLKKNLVKNVLVTMGGTDPGNTTLKALTALNLITSVRLAIKIVLGSGNRHLASIIDEVKNVSHEIEIITNTTNMPEHILWADIAVSAAGSTAWELLYFNIPSIFIVTADNQKRIAEQIEKTGAGINIGWYEHIQIEKLAQEINNFIKNKQLTKKIVKNSCRIVDGKGRKKIILALMHRQKTAGLKINIVSDKDSWITPFIVELKNHFKTAGHKVATCHLVSNLKHGDVAFFLGCGQLISKQQMGLNTHNIVVHESDLPSGKGWSPLSWQILEGRNQIPVSLFEAEEKVDSGPVYLKETISLKGHELVNELRQLLGELTIKLCLKFLETYPACIASAKNQTGKENFYPKRTPRDSRLDINRTIAEQFNLMRVADNDRYPLFFEMGNYTFQLKISKVPGNTDGTHNNQ